MQAEELQHDEEQEKRPRSFGVQQVLQILQEADSSQRNQIILRDVN